MGQARSNQHESSKTGLPGDAIVIRRYDELNRYLSMFARGDLNLVLLLGRPGTGKTEAAKRELARTGAKENRGEDIWGEPLYVEGHAQPYCPPIQ